MHSAAECTRLRLSASLDQYGCNVAVGSPKKMSGMEHLKFKKTNAAPVCLICLTTKEKMSPNVSTNSDILDLKTKHLLY